MNIIKKLFSKKSQTDNIKYMNSEVSKITSSFRQPRFNRAVAMSAYTGYWAAALDANSNAAANGIIRLYSRVSKNGQKCLFPTTQHIDIRQRNYFSGKLKDKPDANVQYKTMNTMEDFEIVVGHPIIDLFIKANPLQSTYQLLFSIFLQLQITGDAFIHVVDYVDGTPAQLYVLQSQYMNIIPAKMGEGRLISGYEYKKNIASPVIYEPDEIIHIKYPNPKSDGLFYGMGVIERGWMTHLLNKFSHEYQVALYANNAVPDYLLINKSGNKMDRKRFFRNMSNISGGGPKNRGKVIAVDGDVDIKTVAFTPKDLSDVQLNIVEIASISGCPINKLIGNDNIKANSEQQNTSWLRNTISPMLKLVASSLSENLLWRYGIEDGDAYLAFDNVVPEDAEQRRKEDETYSKIGIITPNEIRVSLGLEPLGEELDEVYFNGNKLGKNNTGSPAPFPPPEEPEKGAELLSNQLKSKIDTIIKDISDLNKQKDIVEEKPVQPITININNTDSEEDDNE